MARQHQITATVAVALALTASLAPTASADPAPLAPADAVIAAPQLRASTTVRPNPDQQTTTATAATSALANGVASCGDVCSGHGYGSVSPPATIIRVTPDSGFDWGDAGIGAGACVVLLGIGLAARTVTKGRKRHPAEQRPIATS